MTLPDVETVPDLTAQTNSSGEADALRSHGLPTLTGRVPTTSLPLAQPVNLCRCTVPNSPRTSAYPARWCSPACAAGYLDRATLAPPQVEAA